MSQNADFALSKSELQALQGKDTNLEVFMEQLGAGVVKPILEKLLSDIALACMVHSEKKQKGSLALQLTFYPHAELDQIVISHKLNYSLPTATGKKSEEMRGDCGFFVGLGGRLHEEPPAEDWRGQSDMFGS